MLFFCERFLLHTKRKCSRTTMNLIFNSQWRTAFVRKNTKPRRAIHESPAKSHRPKTYHYKRSKKIPKIHKSFQFHLSLRPKNKADFYLHTVFPHFSISLPQSRNAPLLVRFCHFFILMFYQSALYQLRNHGIGNEKTCPCQRDVLRVNINQPVFR